jgi:hypothetical protein
MHSSVVEGSHHGQETLNPILSSSHDNEHSKIAVSQEFDASPRKQEQERRRAERFRITKSCLLTNAGFDINSSNKGLD